MKVNELIDWLKENANDYDDVVLEFRPIHEGRWWAKKETANVKSVRKADNCQIALESDLQIQLQYDYDLCYECGEEL